MTASREPALLTTALCACLALAACSAPANDEGASPDEEPTTEYVSRSWVEREASVRTLDRMFTEGDPDEVIANMGTTRDRLFYSRLVKENDDGYYVELDKDEWNTQGSTSLNQVDGALGDAMYHNEVTWCGETVSGEEFVDAYMDEHWETLDTPEAYEASVVDYVDCGDGQP
ncbi:hypothetical protein KIK06_20715 [Nocardiopsis sp. EMB25]|uniref:hypothetical protein n=1 Tax=Nocardiopsis sp. EMB25 TaxID=2835867 RepID=UPI002283A7F6|nr:hypothetical protein [Nocardiopsis sp. EMB25]MCY9786320.1 hypothetical protein [Nocardiopsis sp. EMB25]